MYKNSFLMISFALFTSLSSSVMERQEASESRLLIEERVSISLKEAVESKSLETACQAF